MVEVILKDNLCLPVHFAIQYIGESPNFLKTFDLNEIKVGRVVKKFSRTIYNISLKCMYDKIPFPAVFKT